MAAVGLQQCLKRDNAKENRAAPDKHCQPSCRGPVNDALRRQRKGHAHAGQPNIGENQQHTGQNLPFRILVKPGKNFFIGVGTLGIHENSCPKAPDLCTRAIPERTESSEAGQRGCRGLGLLMKSTTQTEYRPAPPQHHVTRRVQKPPDTAV